MKAMRLIVTLLLALVSTGAMAQWTVTTQGIIDSGVDQAGFFGTSGMDLTGLTFTETILTGPLRFSDGTTTHDTWYNTGDSELAPSPFYVSVTINKKTILFSTPSSQGTQMFVDGLSASDPALVEDALYSWQTGGELSAAVSVQNTTVPFVYNLSSQKVQIDSTFSATAWFFGPYLNFMSNDLTYVTLMPVPIPEPAEISMLILGLLFVFVTQSSLRSSVNRSKQ